jgi:hypothetical protein
MWTVQRLTEQLQIDDGAAEQILGLIRRTIDPFSVPAVDAWRRQCYHEPRADRPETIMRAIDVVLETCGTEAIWGSSSCTQPVAEYCNAGDTYAATILYDYVAGKYRITSWGDWVERYGDRYGVE